MCSELILAPETVDVWDVPLTGSATLAGTCAAVLSEDERERAEHFHFDRDRERFVVHRGILRFLLSRYAGISPEKIVFGCTPFGKPFLEIMGEEFDGIAFNLSHSEARALYAFGANMRLGVDLEHMRRDVNFGSLVRRFFAPAERGAFFSLDQDQWADAFFAVWTRKEAVLKAEGVGLSMGLDRFELPVKPGIPGQEIRVDSRDGPGKQWSVYDLAVAPGFRGALAVDRPVRQIRRQTWSW